jgi:kinesin family member 5
MSHIFQHINQHKQVESAVSMSFIQIYRENIQDLLSASIVNGQGSNVAEDNLAIREDPQKGFYVEGLQEYVVRSYEEAEALLNLGLENRAIASTLMNSTSSRSHTVITIIIEQKGNIPTGDVESSTPNRFPSSYHRVLRSKLLMVDLAGSERVRKTVSKGTRLDEAKSINTSLSALGNVIAALAESNMSHVPYRDSKLTKILHDSLGGTASTSLVATVGPVPSHYNETLSTLQFGSRYVT